ncbi:transcription factor LHW [Vigna radiata var. radiata]|uniref:Transcription factor LHW n=1 Tax=Vigna radiata var. radiata TaxID=3916 RepID=A0A1S3TJK8_VIGRR|nr:transcription factor LHW [Vigna radiata var. radiata]
MGFLLKEVLRTLCSRNRWSYAVFWKIGCNNSKLLIWEDHYYEPLPSPFPPRTVGMSNFPYRDGEGCWFSSESQLGIQEEDRVGGLINKMMLNNSVSIAGEGMVGRATFTGNYQWILMNNFSRDAYPPEVYSELHYQFSAGMQTVAVIPVLPHGVVQFGSLFPIMEDIGFVNDVKNLILQLGSVPGALLSEDYSAKVSSERLGVPFTADTPVITSKCTPSAANGSNQLTNSTIASRSVAPSPHPPRGEMDNYQGSALTPQTYDQKQIFDSICQPKSHSMVKTMAYSQQKKTVVHTEAKVIPTNFDSCMQQPSAYNSRSAFNELAGFNQLNLSCNLNYMEQQTSGVGRQSQVNRNMNPSSASNMPQLKTGGGKILEQNQSSGGGSLFGGIPICGGSNLLRTNMINCSVSSSPKVPTSEFSGSHKIEFGLQNNNSTTDAGLCSVPNFCNQSVTSHMNLENSAQKNLPIDLKHACDAFVSTDQRIHDDLLHTALNIPSLHLEENEPMGDHIPGFVQDCLNKDFTSMVKMNVKHEETYTQPPSGDDLFDVLGVDLKRKLLNGNWDNLLASDSDANRERLDKKATCMNMPSVRPDNSYSVKEATSDSGIFSGTGTDHLLDAVVSKAQSAPKQSSDEMSCRTTLTRVSTASVSSPACNQVLSDHVLKGLFDFPKNGAKRAAGETSSLRSGCSKDDAGNCSQMTSIYGSKLSSWVENGNSVKRESSVSTGYSKRPEEVCKSNRKRLKPGENPRPRPKDRQMIQDRVKELREIVPNGAKCSIDALLEKTIKHMLFLQSVTKHADKLKQTGESKIVSKEGGLLLKDNFEGGATWAYEVGSQSMVCPIIVEDLNPPRQMLVEMLCEERGFFLEIADLIRGLGLTILKGVMEARNDKIWARFAVEANRDVTRMEIFMSLVRLLDQTVKGGASSSNATDNNMMMYHHSFPQATQIAATGRPSSLQ